MKTIKKAIFKLLKHIHNLQKNVEEYTFDYLRHRNEINKFKEVTVAAYLQICYY